MMTKKMFGYKYLLLMVILLQFVMIISVSAAPIATNNSINVRTNRSYTFNGSEFTGSAIDKIIIQSIPEFGTLFNYKIDTETPIEDMTNIPIADIGYLKYFPNGSDGETDSFTWKIVNATGTSGLATMSINISNGANNPPVAIDYQYAINKNTPQTGTVMAIDPDGDELYYTIKSSVYGTGTNSVLNISPYTGFWEYTNNGSYGSEFVTVTATETSTDIPLSDDSFISIYVNQLFVPQSTFDLLVQTTDPLKRTEVSINATAANGNVGFTTQLSPQQGFITTPYSVGRVAIKDASLKTIGYKYTYTAKPANTGTPDYFIIRCTAQEGGTYQDVRVNVYVNAPPVLTNYNLTTKFNTQKTGTVVATDANTATDGSSYTTALTYSKATEPSNGTATVNTDGSWTYTPTTGYVGTDSFTVSSSDNHGGTSVVNSTITVTTLGNYTVSFDSQGGSNVTSKNADSGDKISAPISPTKENFTFVDWYKELECINVWDFEGDIVTADKTLYAKWNAVPQYTVTVNKVGNGTVTANPIGATVYENQTVTFTITPAAGYQISLIKFDGATVANSGTYTTPAIFANKTLDVTFTLKILTPPSIITENPEFKLNHTFTLEDNFNLKKRVDGQRVANIFKKSSISYAKIINPDDYPLVSYGMILKDKTDGTRLPLNLSVPKTANGGLFAVQVFGKGVNGEFDESDVVFKKDNVYSLQAYLIYTDNGEQKTVYGLEKPFTWQ